MRAAHDQHTIPVSPSPSTLLIFPWRSIPSHIYTTHLSCIAVTRDGKKNYKIKLARSSLIYIQTDRISSHTRQQIVLLLPIACSSCKKRLLEPRKGEPSVSFDGGQPRKLWRNDHGAACPYDRELIQVMPAPGSSGQPLANISPIGRAPFS